MNNTVIGVFQNEREAESAITSLQDRGYTTKDISIVTKDERTATTLENNTGAKVGEGIASGATTGGVIGAIAGLLAGIGAIAIPGGILIGGPILAALGITGTAGATAAGAATGIVAGGIIGALTHLGVPEDDARLYEQTITNGGVLIAVPTKLRGEEIDARAILQSHGASQVTNV